MYESFYNLTEKPFTLLPDPGFLYLSDKHRMALTLLEYGLSDHAGFTVISGEIGAGKTTLIRHMLNNMEHEYTVGLISNTHRSFGELLQWILLAFDLEHKDMNKVEMYQRFIDFIIEEYAQNHRTVLIVDEAQNMDAETLEELRMLSNINADKDQSLQVILVGQRELRETLRRPDLVQFAQRITVDYHLEPLSVEETEGYIRHRLKTAGGDPQTFTHAACEAVHRYSNGVPRLINLLCDYALVYGFAEQSRRISAQLVTDVAREKQQGGIFPVYADAASSEPVEDPEAMEPAAAVDSPAGEEIADDDVRSGQPDPESTVSQEPVSGPVSMEVASMAEPEEQAAEEHAGCEASKEQDKQPSPAATTAPSAAADATSGRFAPDRDDLRIGICAADESSRTYLSRLLEGYGFNVMVSVPLEANTLAWLVQSDIDILMIDHDVSVPLSKDIATIISRWSRPVLYNDATVTARCLREGSPDFGLELAERIHALTESADADVAAV